jgi:hypothetical protein
MSVLEECFLMDITASVNNVPVDTVARLQVLPVADAVVAVIVVDAAWLVSERWQ